MLLILSSIAPVIIVMVYLYYRDKYEKEPIRVLMKAFSGGALAIVTTVIVAFPLQHVIGVIDNLFLSSFINSFVLAAIPEELSKFLFLYLFIWRDKNFNEYYDGIIYAVFVSMGFACIENILYVFQGGYGVAITRAILAIPGHALFGVIMGYYFARARFSISNRRDYLLKGVLLAILAHGIYNFLLFSISGISEINEWFAFILMLVFFAFIIKLHQIGFYKINKHVEASVFKEKQI